MVITVTQQLVRANGTLSTETVTKDFKSDLQLHRYLDPPVLRWLAIPGVIFKSKVVRLTFIFEANDKQAVLSWNKDDPWGFKLQRGSIVTEGGLYSLASQCVRIWDYLDN